MDAFLVRNGEIVGVCLAVLVTLVVLGLFLALRARARRAQVIRVLGPRDRLSADSVGKTIVLEGEVREGARVEGFAEGGDDLVAASVRVASADDDEGALVARRGRDLGLVVDGQHVRVAGEVVVVSSADPTALSARAARALRGEDDAEVRLVEHAIVRGTRAFVKARLERDDSGYRGGGWVLVATSDGPPRLMSARPAARAATRGAATVGLVVLPLLLGAGQLASLSLASQVRERESLPRSDDAPADELPLGWTHRLALLGHRPVDALLVFDRLLAHGHVTPALLAMAADAHARRGDCARGIELFAAHGAYELGRAYTARCDLRPAVLVARAELERADGHAEEALAWIDRNRDDALSVPRDREVRWVSESFRALLAIEAGRYEEAATEIETRVRPTLGRDASDGQRRSLECLRRALILTAGGTAERPTLETPACTLLRFELYDERPDVWWSGDVGDLRWIAAAAAYTSHDAPWTLSIGPPSSWLGIHAVLHGEWPRWDGSVREALAAARAAEGTEVISARCQLELAEAAHRYARTGEMTPPSDVCATRGDDRLSLVALDRGGPAPPHGSAERYAAFRDTPSLAALREITFHRPTEIAYHGEHEGCVSGCLRSMVPAPDPSREETPLERAAVAGDARALRVLVGDGLALRFGRRNEDEVALWYANRLRPTGGPRTRLFRLRDAAYTDLFLARRSEDEAEIRRVEERIDRLDAVIANRRRVILLEAYWLAIE